jgi:hypothetical protein
VPFASRHVVTKENISYMLAGRAAMSVTRAYAFGCRRLSAAAPVKSASAGLPSLHPDSIDPSLSYAYVAVRVQIPILRASRKSAVTYMRLFMSPWLLARCSFSRSE